MLNYIIKGAIVGFVLGVIAVISGGVENIAAAFGLVMIGAIAGGVIYYKQNN